MKFKPLRLAAGTETSIYPQDGPFRSSTRSAKAMLKEVCVTDDAVLNLQKALKSQLDNGSTAPIVSMGRLNTTSFGVTYNRFDGRLQYVGSEHDVDSIKSRLHRTANVITAEPHRAPYRNGSVGGVILGSIGRYSKESQIIVNQAARKADEEHKLSIWYDAMYEQAAPERDFTSRFDSGEANLWQDDTLVSQLPRIGALREARRITEVGGFLLSGNQEQEEHDMTLSLGFEVAAAAARRYYRSVGAPIVGETLYVLANPQTPAGQAIDQM